MKKKNPHAVALGRKGGKARAAKYSPAELSALASTSFKNLTAEERTEIARKAAKARWAKERKKR